MQKDTLFMLQTNTQTCRRLDFKDTECAVVVISYHFVSFVFFFLFVFSIRKSGTENSFVADLPFEFSYISFD